jgi:hypothetical protein
MSRWLPASTLNTPAALTIACRCCFQPLFPRQPRQRLDLYLPEQYSKDALYPVAVFVTGGRAG